MSGQISLGSQLLSIPLTGVISSAFGGLSCGITASLNRALYIENLIRKFDSTFYSPSFKDGCALGGAYAVGSMVQRTAEIIDANSTKFCDSHPKVTEVAFIILSYLVTFTCAKHGIATSMNAEINMVQWSLSIYMVGASLSQLIYGPLSEGIGRKKPILFGLFIMFLGSLICSLSSSVEMLITGRLVQGCGAGAVAALWRSIFRDIFKGEELAKYTSYLVILIMFIVPAAPALGGYFQHYFGWRASFIFMLFYTLIALIAIKLGLTETNVHRRRDRLKLKYISSTFLTLLKSPLFMGMTFSTFLTYGAFFSWFVAGPVLLIKLVGISPAKFGWLTLIFGGAAYASAGFLNGKFVTRFGMTTMMRFGWIISIFSGLLMLVTKFLWGINVWNIMVPVTLFYFGSTFIWPNAFSTAFTPFGKVAGYAGALYGSMQIGGAAALGSLVSFLPDTNQVPLSLIFIFASALAWITYEQTKPANR